MILGDRRASDAVHCASAEALGLDGDDVYYFIRFAAADAWYEEDDPLVCHPRDPYTRVDVRAASRDLRIELDGIKVAETQRPLLLFETGLPVRYYVPWADIAVERLVASETRSVCCDKGRARYWPIHTPAGEYHDMAWGYPEPLDDAVRVRHAGCFYQTALSLYLMVCSSRAPRACSPRASAAAGRSERRLGRGGGRGLAPPGAMHRAGP